MPPTIIDLVREFRRQLNAKDRAALERLITAYAHIKKGVDASIDALLIELDLLGKSASVGKVRKLERLRRLQQSILEEITRFQGFLSTEIRTEAAGGIALGEQHAGGYLASVGLGFQRLNPDVIETLVGFLEPAGPLFKRIEYLAPATAQLVTDEILKGVALGRNPRAIGAGISRAFGIGLQDSLRMMRTAQNYAYRYANHATYRENDSVLEGWQWFANLATCCRSCMNQHGSIHPLTEELKDHHNGACTPVPVIRGRAPFVVGTGQEYFEALPEHLQRERLGAKFYEAYKEGKFDFAALSTAHQDEVYGVMLHETSLKALLGE